MVRRFVACFHRNAVAFLALFVALGGTSYAALRLPPGSVGTKQLKNGAVTTAKVRDGSILPADLASMTKAMLKGAPGPAGAVGPAGPAGAKGDKGDKGDPGQSALVPLASGQTESGAWAGGDGAPATDHTLLSFGWFRLPLPAVVPASNIVYVASGTAPHCGGIDNADPGFLCLYQQSSFNIASPAGVGVFQPTAAPGAGKYGFAIASTETAPSGVNFASLAGTYTYTAP